MSRLTADFSAAFSRDLKKKAKRRNWDLNELQKLIDLVLENTPESTEILKRRHNMHRLSGSWAGRNECHVANSGDWLVIWSANDEVAFFERTGGHDELFRLEGFSRRELIDLERLPEYARVRAVVARGDVRRW